MALVYGLPIFQISLDSSQVHEPFEYGHQKAETVSLHLSTFDPLQEFSLPLIFNFRFEYNRGAGRSQRRERLASPAK